jgi:hypothetical protein
MAPRLRAVSNLARRSTAPTVVLLAAVVTLVAVLLTPLGLQWIGHRPGHDWPLLGNVGQAYGAASAILAALALVGVVASLVLQAREAKVSREQALRALHTEAHLEVLARQFFQGASGRRFWAEAREPRAKAEASRRARRFTAILDRSYLAAAAGGPATDERPQSELTRPAHRPRRLAGSPAAMIGAAVIGAVAAVVSRRLWDRSVKHRL